MTSEEKERIGMLNDRYKRKFGFPFVICARLNKKEAILSGLETRFDNEPRKELNIAIGQVLMICELRVKDIVLESKL